MHKKHPAREREVNSNFVELLGKRALSPQQAIFAPSLKGDPYFVKRFTDTYDSLKGHQGCVNSVVWNQSGNLILSGSDDCKINIWSPFEHQNNPLIHSIPSGHHANIFSARFMTNTGNRHIVSCAADGIVKFTDLDAFISQSGTSSWNPCSSFQCHSDLTYEVLPDPIDPNIFFDCSDDGTINQYDLRIRTSCDCDHCSQHTLLDLNQKRRPQREKRKLASKNSHMDNLEETRSQSEPESEQQSRRRRRPFILRSSDAMSITGITIRPDNTVYLAAACSDDTVRIYDRRFIKPPSENAYHRDSQVYSFIPNEVKHDKAYRKEARRRFEPLYHRMTCLKYDPSGGGDLLASYSRGKVYLIRPGGGKIDQIGKPRLGGIRAVKKKKLKDNKDESENVLENLEILNSSPQTDIALASPNVAYDPKGKTKEMIPDNTSTTSSNREQDNISTLSSPKESNLRDVDAILEEESNFISLGQNDHLNNEDIDMEDDNEDDNDFDDNICSSDEDEDLTEYDILEGKNEDIVRSFGGHLNEKTMIKEANFFGGNSQYIMTGSDDRRIFIWDKSNGRIVNILIGDKKVVNCIQPHPFFPIMCTSGIDNDVKIWYPCAEDDNDISQAEEILERNSRLMSDGNTSRRRIVVIPSNMILQMLAILNQGGTGGVFHLEDD
ncbi:hypothetical protein G9A89_008293 [Geosiphon pyriformis]|nr:hypothetical protein G9A89_008293 [Geosiphon pyriformis]